jgi:hypothetical protein
MSVTQPSDPGVPPWAVRPDWADRLVAEMERDFKITADGRPGWLDPHEGDEPDELTYSVCSDPDKYRILDSRVEAWARALVRLGLAELTTPPPGVRWVAALRSVDQIDRQWILTPSVQRGLRLSFARTLVDGRPFGVDVGVGAEDLPTVYLESVPDCGCDACDHGSQPELEAIDAVVLAAARGGVVHARDGQQQATAGILSWHTTNSAPEDWLDADIPAPHGVQRWLGDPWLTR